MTLPTLPGAWRGFLERGGTSRMEVGDDDTQPPSQPMNLVDVPLPVPAINPHNLPNHQLNPVPLMTLDELLLAPGRMHLPNLDPLRSNGAGWFGYTKGITKSVKKIMENDFPDTAPNWSLLKGETKERWFKAFAQKYNWDYSQTTYVREEFEALCSSRLLDRVYEWKVLWRKNEDNKPTWMKDTVWTGFIVYWTLEKNKLRSLINSQNRLSPRGGYGISKHTCGSCPYIRMRENMRDEITGELPDMVTFMERTHKRKRDGVFVDKKAEVIAKKCRDMQLLKQTQMSEEDDTCGDIELTPAELNAIYDSEVQVNRGRRYGYGRMEVEDSQPKANNWPDYKQMYLDTLDKLVEATNKLDGVSAQVEDAVFWSNLMRSMHPNAVPPSQATTENTAPNNNTSV